MHTLFDEGLADPRALAAHVAGLDEVRALAGEFSPEAVAATCGDRGAGDPAHGARAGGRAAAPRSTGASAPRTQRFGTTASWLVDVLNVLTGNLDRPGGAMFPRTAVGSSNTRRRARARARRAPSGAGAAACAGWARSSASCPAACLAEEIETPGEGQVRALITVAGNPAVSTPNSDRLAAALERLDFMVSVDIYVNETTRHADVILPAPSPLQRSHYDVALLGFAVRNVANYSPPVLAPDPEMPAEWETLLRLTGVVTGQGPNADVAAHRPLRRARDGAPRRPPTRTRPSTAAIPRSCWPRSSRASGPSGCSTCCCARGPLRG